MSSVRLESIGNDRNVRHERHDCHTSFAKPRSGGAGRLSLRANKMQFFPIIIPFLSKTIHATHFQVMEVHAKDLLTAAEDGDLLTVKRLIEKGAWFSG